MDSKNTKGVVYKVNFTNNSPNYGSIMLFQKSQNTGGDQWMSLAWFTESLYPAGMGSLEWTLDYSFVWSETGVLKPGITFVPSQSPSADLATFHSIGFTYDKTYHFVNKENGTPSGNLCISEDGSIPLEQASVGIGMSGSGVFAVQAQPNMDHVFAPHPEYWIAFGDYTTGQVLNIDEITHCTMIDFPPGVYTVNVSLNSDNSWTVEPAEQN